MIRVFIGTEPSLRLATAVLRHSILSRTNEPVEFVEMQRMDLAYIGKTGFSLYRFSIPHRCGYAGRAIYMDADIVVLGNIAELWNMPLDKPALARPSFNKPVDSFTSVMLLDCERLKHWDWTAWISQCATDEQFANRLIWARPTAPNHDDFDPLNEHWNSLDLLKPGTKALHFTQLDKQPWSHAGHRYAHVFRSAEFAARAYGSLTYKMIEEEIRAGHVRADYMEVA